MVIEVPRQPQYLTIAIRPDVDMQRQQMALLILPPPVTSIHPEAEIKYLPAAEARMLDGLRRQMAQLDRPMVLVPTVPDGQVPPVFPMNGCRTCKHGQAPIGHAKGLIPCSTRPAEGVVPEHGCPYVLCEPWNYCEWHEEREPEVKT